MPVNRQLCRVMQANSDGPWLLGEAPGGYQAPHQCYRKGKDVYCDSARNPPGSGSFGQVALEDCIDI